MSWVEDIFYHFFNISGSWYIFCGFLPILTLVCPYLGEREDCFLEHLSLS